MSLQAIIDDIQKYLPEGVTQHMGREKLKAESAPPRIVWVPTKDTFAPVQARQQNVNPRSLLTRVAGVDVHIWGAPTANSPGFTETEALANAFEAALLQSVGWNFDLTGGLWKGQAFVSLGRVYVLSLNVKVPVLEAPLQQATITNAPVTTQFPT